ncbi:hypothetical protein AKJ16_DCAP07223 [Drosera capensis]
MGLCAFLLCVASFLSSPIFYCTPTFAPFPPPLPLPQPLFTSAELTESPQSPLSTVCTKFLLTSPPLHVLSSSHSPPRNLRHQFPIVPIPPRLGPLAPSSSPLARPPAG